MKKSTLLLFALFTILFQVNAQVTIGNGDLESENAPFEPEAGAYAGGHSHNNHHGDTHKTHIHHVEPLNSMNDIEGFTAVESMIKPQT